MPLNVCILRASLVSLLEIWLVAEEEVDARLQPSLVARTDETSAKDGSQLSVEKRSIC
jgi:hypothetical protein